MHLNCKDLHRSPRNLTLLIIFLAVMLSSAFCFSVTAQELDSPEKSPNSASKAQGRGPNKELLPPESRPGFLPRPNAQNRHWEKFGPGPLNLVPLNLTPEQKQKIQEIRKRTGVKARNLRKTLKEKRIEMRDAMFDPDISEAKLQAMHKEINRLRQKAEDGMFEDFLSIRALLTAEQKKHLPEIKPPFSEPPGPPESVPPEDNKNKQKD